MRIGITGAHSTGKTTLLNALRSEPSFKHLTVCTEVTRDIRKLGLEINEGGSDISQKLIMNQHIVNIFMHENMITDRISLDGLIYTEWLHENGKVSFETLEYAEKVFEKTFPLYDFILYIPVEFGIEDDGVRSTDYGFQSAISRKFERWVSNYKNNKPYIFTISGTVRERIVQSMKALEKFTIQETPSGQDPF